MKAQAVAEGSKRLMTDTTEMKKARNISTLSPNITCTPQSGPVSCRVLYCNHVGILSNISWAAVGELNLSYHNPETILSTIYLESGNFLYPDLYPL